MQPYVLIKPSLSFLITSTLKHLGKTLAKSTFILFDFKFPLCLPSTFFFLDRKGLMSSSILPKAILRIIFIARRYVCLFISSGRSCVTLGLAFQGPTQNKIRYLYKNTDISHRKGRFDGLEERVLVQMSRNLVQIPI